MLPRDVVEITRSPQLPEPPTPRVIGYALMCLMVVEGHGGPLRPWRQRLFCAMASTCLSAALITASASWLPLAGSRAASPSSTPERPETSLQISYPPGTTKWLLEYFISFLAGVGFLFVVNQFVSRRRNLAPSQSLAREVARLRRLIVGYPEGMSIFEGLRSLGLLEKRFSSLGLAIEWRSYPSASSLLNDLSQGRIHFCGGGGTASIFSQAAHHFFIRVAREKYPELDADAILVPDDSPIQSIADLAGKRIAFDEGSSAHYVLVRALQAAGISYDKIDICMLPQQDALALFRAGQVDAWVVWMPYALTNQRRQYPGRSLGNLHSILGHSVPDEVPTLYYAIPELVRDYPRILKAILEEVNEAGVWLNQQRLAWASQARSPAITLACLRQRSLERALVPLDEPTLLSLQRQANLFHQLGIIEERVNVRDGAFSLRTRQNWTY